MNVSKSIFPQLLLILFSLCFVISCKSSKDAVKVEPRTKYYFDGKVKFLNAKDLTEAIETAQEEKKPLFVEFYTDWCLPCKILSEEVFIDDRFASKFNSNFVNYKINAEDQHGANMKFLYNISEVPTLLFVDHNGKEIERIVGSTHQSTLLNSANRVINNWDQAE